MTLRTGDGRMVTYAPTSEGEFTQFATGTHATTRIDANGRLVGASAIAPVHLTLAMSAATVQGDASSTVPGSTSTAQPPPAPRAESPRHRTELQ